MRELESTGLTDKQLAEMNPERLHQQALFLSDILGVSGKALDWRYLVHREDYDTWSNIKFPKERPSSKARKLWRDAIKRLVPAGGITDRLGEFLGEGYKVWEWRHD
jgi:hypothetical protein